MELFGKICCKFSTDGPDACVSFYKDDTTNERQIQITDHNIPHEKFMSLTAKISPRVTVEYAKTGTVFRPSKEKTADEDWPTSSIIAVVNGKRATISARYDENNNILIRIPIDIMDWPASFIWSLASELQTRFRRITADIPRPIAYVTLRCSEPMVDMCPDAIPKVDIEDVIFDIKEIIGNYGNVLCVKCNTDPVSHCTLCPPRTLSYRLLHQIGVKSIIYKQTSPWRWDIKFPGSQNNAYWWDLVHHCAVALECLYASSTMYFEDGMYKIQLGSSQPLNEEFIRCSLHEGLKGYGTDITESSEGDIYDEMCKNAVEAMHRYYNLPLSATKIEPELNETFSPLIFKLKDGCTFAIRYEQTVMNRWRILLPDYRKNGSPVRDEYIATCEDILSSLCLELNKIFSLVGYNLKDMGACIVCEDEGDAWRVNASCIRTAIFNGMREHGTFISCS